jgi:predicted RNA binding protein YcfA (HicA-like mRNA interferase family)
MPKFPRDVSQTEAVRALLRAGGVEIARQGKGSHRAVRMPNGRRIILPYHLKPGLLRDMIKEAGLTVDEFIDLL